MLTAQAGKTLMGTQCRASNRLKQALQLETPDKDLAELREEAATCPGDFVGLEPTIWDFPTRRQLATGRFTSRAAVQGLELIGG